MATLNLLYKNEYVINEFIKVVIPSVGQILEDEDSYYKYVSIFTATPFDYMVQLDEIGIDFTTINDYDLFILLMSGLINSEEKIDTSLLISNIDFTKLKIVKSSQNNAPVLIDENGNVIIDRAIHGRISATLRTIHHTEKNTKTPANEEAKKYLIQRTREKQARHKNRQDFSHLESLIIAMVNTEQYKYDFEGTKELSIYQFNESVRQIIKKIDYDNRMYGVYAGTINAKELSQEDLNWLIHK